MSEAHGRHTYLVLFLALATALNERAFAIQQELRWMGITTVILSIRINI